MFLQLKSSLKAIALSPVSENWGGLWDWLAGEPRLEAAAQLSWGQQRASSSWGKMALMRDMLCIRWLIQVFLPWGRTSDFKCFWKYCFHYQPLDTWEQNESSKLDSHSHLILNSPSVLLEACSKDTQLQQRWCLSWVCWAEKKIKGWDYLSSLDGYFKTPVSILYQFPQVIPSFWNFCSASLQLPFGLQYNTT